MKQILFFMLIVTAAFGCTASTSPTSDATTPTQAAPSQNAPAGKVTLLSPAAFKAKMGGTDVQLLDIRTASETAGGMIANAKNLDFYQPNFKEELGKLDKSKPLMLYCASGRRSTSAADMAVALGFKEVINLQGGYSSIK